MKIYKVGLDYIGSSGLGSGDFSSFGSLEGMVSAVLGAAIMLSGVVAVGYFILAGYNYIVGESGNVKKAKEGLTWGAVGIGVVLASVPIYQFIVGDVLGGTPII